MKESVHMKQDIKPKPKLMTFNPQYYWAVFFPNEIRKESGHWVQGYGDN